MILVFVVFHFLLNSPFMWFVLTLSQSQDVYVRKYSAITHWDLAIEILKVKKKDTTEPMITFTLGFVDNN